MWFPFRLGGLGLPRRLDLPDADDLSNDELEEMTRTEALATRIAAARALAARSDERALPVLLDGVSSRHFRYPALEGLRFLRDERSREPAARVMNGMFSGVFDRTQAAGILATLGDPAGVEYLLSRLRARKRDDDRGLAIEISADIEMHEAVPELERMADDHEDIFRGAALKALFSLDRGRYEDMLCSIAADEGEDPDVRSDVIEVLARRPGPKTRRAIEAACRSSSPQVSDVAEGLLSPESE